MGCVFGQSAAVALQVLTSFTLHKSPRYTEATDICSLWKTFLAEGIHLEELSVDQVGIELMDFIASFSGLHHLTLLHLGGSRDPSHDMAEIFFRHAIPIHRNTSHYLNLQAMYEGWWCFSEDNATIILDCQKLSDLSIVLRWEDYHGGNNQRSPVVG
jgi:hypothetical protein